MIRRKYRHALEIILVATCLKHQHCAGFWDTKINDGQACPSEAMRILIMLVSHPCLDFYGYPFRYYWHHPRPGSITSWVTDKAPRIIFPTFTLHTPIMIFLSRSIFITLCPCLRSSRNLLIACWMESELPGLAFTTRFHKSTSTVSSSSPHTHSGPSASVMGILHWPTCTVSSYHYKEGMGTYILKCQRMFLQPFFNWNPLVTFLFSLTCEIYVYTNSGTWTAGYLLIKMNVALFWYELKVLIEGQKDSASLSACPSLTSMPLYTIFHLYLVYLFLLILLIDNCIQSVG